MVEEGLRLASSRVTEIESLCGHMLSLVGRNDIAERRRALTLLSCKLGGREILLR